jgi:hypothetical protein
MGNTSHEINIIILPFKAKESESVFTTISFNRNINQKKGENLKMPKNLATNKLTILRNRSTTIALLLVLTIAATFITCLPAVNAVNIKTFAYLSLRPNPVGVSQSVLVVFWLNQPPVPTMPATFWENIIVTVTAPDNHQTTLGPFKSDYVG